MDSDFLLPWEHQVCPKCLYQNPHAIWLVKYGCFERFLHRFNEDTQPVNVVIVHETMQMVRLRPLPSHISFSGQFVMCRFKSGCRIGDRCKFPHSKAEQDAWNAKKSILNDEHCMEVISDLQECGVWSVSPSDVCLECYHDNNNAVWLSHFTCIRPNEHTDSDTITVVVSDSQNNQQLIPVRPADHLSRLTVGRIAMCKHDPSYCPRGESCLFAHSDEELNYWRWERAKEILDNEFPLFEERDFDDFYELCETYAYPDENSDVITSGVQCDLTCSNYRSKYHKLVFLDNLEHARKMARECDGVATFVVGKNKVHITEMKNGSAAMDYAIQNKASVKFSVHGYNYDGDRMFRNLNTERDSLTVEIKQSGFFRRFHLYAQWKTFVHFNISHWYFWRLHRAIARADNRLIERLVMPRLKHFELSDIGRRGSYKLDQEYQFQALKKMLSCKPGAPYLLLGPFGTGKTYVLAAFVERLLSSSHGNRILVCTHQNTGADKLYRSLQENLDGIHCHALRLVPDTGGLNRNSALLQPYSCRAVHKIKVHQLAQWEVIITTFLTALTIKDKLIKEKTTLHFSHIVIDEGAQSREPEALGALVLADPNTHIVIAGDHRQVGPKVAVYNRTAQEEGLGTSLLERLFSVYKGTKAEHSHVSTLLTNYRCHPSILMLASSLFYECTLLSRSNSKALPLAPFPVVFECSSINEGNFANLPAEDRNESLILVQRMLDYIQSDWPKNEKQTSVGLLASTRKQAARLRRVFYDECKRRKTSPENLPCRVEIIPTFIIQGEEFSAVFLSTVEPTNDKGHTRNPVRSVCNEYVFNTIITRARCLVYVIGNPFLLLHMGAEFSVNCWKEYIQRCVTCQTFILPKMKDPGRVQQLPEVMSTISKKVLPLQQLDRAVSSSEVNDEILSQYMKVFRSRDEQKAAFSLVQDPKGMKYWRYEDSDSEDSDSGKSSPDDVILVKLKFDSYRTGVAIPEDSSRAPLPITTLHGRRGGFQDDVVQYDTRNKCILLDKETEKAFNSQHFAASFLCRVNTRNPVEFFPLDTTYPKFINLPTLTKKEREGVVMFDPASINKCPRMNNFIPMQCAVNMVFIVKFLRWRKQFNYPLGIIVGALPSGQSIESGDLLLRVAHSVPLDEQQVKFRKPLNRPSRSLSSPPIFENAIAIDPAGSHDHDDALTCRRIIQTTKFSAYEIGVHITSVQKFVRQGSDLDKVAFKRGCSVYRASDCCISNMLPLGLIKEASLCKGSTRDSFSVVGKATIRSGVVTKLELVKIVASQVKCERELTYSEAQAVLYSGRKEDQLHILWQVASYLRSKRLGEASHCFIAGEADEELHPEAHLLVEELMIWANQGVAALLMKTFPENTILRRQLPPNGSDLKLLVKERSPILSTSCALRQYVPPAQGSSGKFYLLQTVYETIVSLLEAGQVTRALHHVQFEHLHPQTAVAHSLFNQIRGPSTYCTRAILSDADDAVMSHHSLNCELYTRFTSPLRRFVDLVIQRLLHAVLQGENSPYQDEEELKKICYEVRDSEKRADAYCGDMKKLFLACQLRKNAKEYVCFIKKIERSQIQLTFPDRGLKSMSKNRIHFRNLNMSGSTKVSPNSSATSLSQESDSDSSEMTYQRYKWKAKIASVTGSPARFLDHSHLLLVSNAADEDSSVHSSPDSSEEDDYLPPSDDSQEGDSNSRTSGSFAELSFFVPEGRVETQDDAKKAHLKEVKATAMIKPFTCSITQRDWKKIQKRVQLDPSDIDPEGLADLFDSDDTEDSLPPADSSLRTCTSPLWIYTVHRPLQVCDVMKAQLTANFNQYTHTLTPSVQLLEVGPNLRVCIQHSSNPIECFTDRPTENASRLDYNSINQYFRFWEQVILAEAAAGSLNDSDLLLIKDVGLQWPSLEMKVDATGHVYYQLPVSKELLTSKMCISVTFPKHFAMSSYDFFQFSAGDLVCLRCDREGTVGEDNGGPVRCVFHMIVHDVDKVETEEGETKEITEVNIYLRFVSDRLNYISPEFARVIKNDKRSIKYEIQLIPLTLPARRIYQCLRQMVAKQKERGYTLAQEIALGEARTMVTKPPSVELKLPSQEAQVATTLWNSSSSISLNPYQRRAVELALSNKFVMIQGPPGTGKSVTGAHIAYALAIKLKIDRAGRHRGSNEPSPCVMYCGPSQQSVNVVLKVLLSCEEVKKDLTIMRVFSKAIENKDYQGSNYHQGVFRKTNTDGECDADCAEYALHHIIRQRFPVILRKERMFKQLKDKGKIPSDAMRRDFKTLVFHAETTVLKGGVDIVLCTCNEASSHRITNSLRPVYLIVDECAMSTEPESMVPIRLASNVVLIGDHNQLQPVIQNQEAKGMGLGISLFERYAGVLERRGGVPHLLKEQYRMLRCLCQFPSDEFYGGRLQTSPTVEKRYSSKLGRLQDFWPRGCRKPFVFCNIVGSEDENHNAGQDGTAPVGVESKRNNKEAKKIARIARELINYGVDASEIAALTPYSAQRNEIRQELRNYRVRGVPVKTITDSQGSEFGIVLLSTVRSKNIKDITTEDGRRMKADFGWIKANLGFITDRHQICVGITRCKYGLIIVGNETLLCYDATWRKLIQHYKYEGCLVRYGDGFPRARRAQARGGGGGAQRAPSQQ